MRVLLDRRTPVAAAVAAALIAVALAGGGYSPLAQGVSVAAVWIVLGALALGGRLRYEVSGPFLVAAGSLLALLGLTVASLSWASGDAPAFAEIVRVAGYLGVLLLAGLTDLRSRGDAVYGGIAIAVVAIALLSLGSRLLLADGDPDIASALPTSAGRLSYPLGYWNALGALMAIGLVPIAWLAATARNAMLRGAALACFAPPLLVAYMASSRGGLLAAAIGIGIVVGFATDRRTALAAALVGVAAAVPAIAAATAAPAILDTAGGGSPGRAEAGVLLALAFGMAAAAWVGPRLVRALARSRILALGVPVGAWPIAFVVVIAVLVAAVGPTVLVGDLGNGGGEATTQRTTGVVSASGSGRSEFWQTALDAFAEEPVRGIGAGGYEYYWNENGALRSPTRNAHSEPLEVLAELGLAGLACLVALLGAILLAATGAARRRDGGPAAVGLGVVAAALVGFSIDWTWQFPAVVAPFLLAAAVLLAGAPARRRDPLRLPAAATVAAVVVIGAGSVWAAGVLGVAQSRLDAAEEAMADGHLDEAAAAARAAMAVEPWSAEPWLRLAEAEQLAGNDIAALQASKRAIQLAPDDYRGWLLAAGSRVSLGDTIVAGAYRTHGLELYPLVPTRE